MHIIAPSSGPGPLGSARLDATFAALADPTRRAILVRLAAGEAPVNELAEPFAMSQPAISKHLKVLERAGLISRGRDAQRRPRKLEAAPLAEADQWLEGYRQFWEARYQLLDAVLADRKAVAAKPSPHTPSPRTRAERRSRGADHATRTTPQHGRRKQP